MLLVAGMSAVFRTPLGTALLTAEVLYRDALRPRRSVPAVIASVVAFATIGQHALFGGGSRRIPSTWRTSSLWPPVVE